MAGAFIDAFPLAGPLADYLHIPLMAHYGIAGAMLASAVIFLYDGTRGFIRGNAAKYAFYSVYPAHLLLIAALI